MQQYSPTLLYSKTLAEHFGEDTDRYWREYIARSGFVAYDPTGTCKMGKAEDPMAVVDPELRVIGDPPLPFGFPFSTVTTVCLSVDRRGGGARC